MIQLELAGIASSSNSRHVITLSNDKRLVSFRLPKIGCDSKATDQWEYYCMEAECPHAGGPMEDARIEYDVEDSSYIASCPWHAYDFNVETGKSAHGIRACTFHVELIHNTLYLMLDAEDDLAVTEIAPVSEVFPIQQTETTPAATRPSANARVIAGIVSGESQTTSGTNDGLPDNRTFCERCVSILETPDPDLKIILTNRLYREFCLAETTCSPMPIGRQQTSPPDEPPRMAMQTVAPGQMPKLGRGGNVKSRIAMLHSLANIEQWAIDLALDICARFASFETASDPPRPLPRTFFADWLKVANDEAKHFSLLRQRLVELGSTFGALPVHHGLWESAALTSHDLQARISIIALVHEARGLDVNPLTIQKFRNSGDMVSVESLLTIHHDEITHVTTGHRWLSWICEQEGTDPIDVFRSNVKKYFRGSIKGPFNEEARRTAGLEESFYTNLEGRPKHILISGG